MNSEQLRGWIGPEEFREGRATAAPLKVMAATLDHSTSRDFACGDTVPSLWHRTHLLRRPRQSQLGKDDRPVNVDLQPRVTLPPRIWAGGLIKCSRLLHVGQKISRRSAISDVSFKEGRTRSSAFVKLHHVTSNDGGIAIVDNQDNVYRNPPKPAPRPATPLISRTDAQWSRTVKPKVPLLFRYSALTFNGHRIPYDRPCAEGQESYGVVVHGPFIATLLLNLLRSKIPDACLVAHDFHAVHPLLDTTTFEVCRRTPEPGTMSLWAVDAKGFLATGATARIA